MLNSLNDLQRAEPDPGLFDVISQRIDQMPAKGSKTIPMTYIRLAAACFAGLIIVNLWAITGRRVQSSKGPEHSPSESTAWQMKRANYQIYDL